MSFTWTELIPNVGHENAHVATLTIVTGICVGLGLYAKKSLGTGEAAVIPANKVSVRGIFELLTESITNLSDMVVGHHGRHYVPMFTAVFFFILFNNFIGLIPGMAPATENINTSFAMGITIFVTYNLLGLIENGPVKYMAHFFGPKLPWFLSFISIGLFAVELFSHCLRPLTLGLRLANVLKGDHAVLAAFLDLVPFGVPMIFYLMGTLVSLIQALVFTLLSMVYIALATAHDH